MWNLIKHYCGADLLDASFKHLLNGDPGLDGNYMMSSEEYRLLFMSQEPNTSFDKGSYDRNGALYTCYYYNDGDRVLKINGHIEKCGYIICRTGRIVK